MSRLFTTGLTLGLAAAALSPFSAAAQRPSPSRSQAVLDALVTPREWQAPDPQPAPSVRRGTDRGVGMATVGEHDGRPYAYMTQHDSTGRTPAAAVGDTIVAIAPAAGERRSDTPRLHRFTVGARRRWVVPAGEGGCGMPEYSGWAYLLEGDASVFPVSDWGGHEQLLAVPGPLAWRAPTPAPQPLRTAFQPLYLSIARAASARAVREYASVSEYDPQSIRDQVLGEDGTARWEQVVTWAVRGPAGSALAVTSFELQDDPSDHGLTTRRTMLLSAAGQVIAEAPEAYELVTVLDLDADGIDEILTRDGVIRWNGSRWVFPTRYAGGSC